MPDYDRQQFAPPAPLARVTVRTLDRTQSVADVAMLIDSGADATFIPQTCANQLGLLAEIEHAYHLEDFRGRPSAATGVNAEIVFLGRNFHGRFLLVEGECGILGRNVLNHLTLVLDGPRLTWRVEFGR